MIYFLDTNIISYALKDSKSNIWDKLRTIPSTNIAIPTIVLAEIEYGSRKSNNYKKTHDLYFQFISTFEIFPFCGYKMEEAYGKIRADLEKKGEPIGGNDLLIAAMAMAENGILVTHNTKEFNRINGLKVEDWTL